MEKKDNKRELVRSVADLLGGICTTAYAQSLLTAICPPAGIAASIGCGLLSGALGDFGGDKAKRIVDSCYSLKDTFSKKSKENPDAISEDYKID